MNVADAIQLALILGAIGGIIHGVGVYHGVVWPKTFEADVPIDPDDENSRTRKMSLWVPGVLGEMLLGAVAAGLVLCSTLRPDEVYNLNAALKDAIVLSDLAVFLLAGLGASVVINKYLESRGWDKIIAQGSDTGADTQTDTTTKPEQDNGDHSEDKLTLVRTVTTTRRRVENSRPVLQAVAGVRPWRYIESLQPSKK